MKCDVELEVRKRLVDCAKLDLVVGMKRREADIPKLKLDHATIDLAESHTMGLDSLSQEAQNIKPSIKEKACKDSSTKSSSKKDEQRFELLMSEAIFPEEHHAKLSEQNDAEISVLLSEKLKTIESKFNHELKMEQTKVKEADKEVEKLKF
uniref:Uncharacterized protein n=1 Tax=Kalanchoe fedtschenkoi TaxID=63787 RepID=A0A7N0UK59_KALFE